MKTLSIIVAALLLAGVIHANEQDGKANIQTGGIAGYHLAPDAFAPAVALEADGGLTDVDTDECLVAGNGTGGAVECSGATASPAGDVTAASIDSAGRAARGSAWTRASRRVTRSAVASTRCSPR